MKHIWMIALVGVLAVTTGTPVVSGDTPPFTPAQGGFVPPKPKDGFRYPDCFCTDSQGKRIEMGQTTCLQIGSSQFMAQCSMSLNNPTWRRVQDGCPTS